MIDEASILCKVVAKDIADFPPLDTHVRSEKQDASSVSIFGSIIAIPCRPLDLALRSIGGAQLLLCLVSLAEVSAAACRLLHISLNGERRHTSCLGQLPFCATAFVVVGKIRRIWNESVRTTVHVHVRR